MPRIAVLPSAVADQIAAGEVVERPASVVKELIENALDAGAGAIELVIEDGGRRSIRVSDDGSGMDREDAMLALSRHATSKIRRADDLVGVRSFGFRGEALPAICSVAHLVLETAAGDGAGTRVRAAGGEVLEVADVARRIGTTVTVSRLFFNAPARQRFLRTARGEWRGIADVLTSVALTRRDVRVSVTHDGKPALALPPAPDLRARLAALLGARAAEPLVDVEDVCGVYQVSGLVERPVDAGTATRRVFFAVNGRAVRDAGLVRAAEAGYRSTIPAGVRPCVFLELTMPAELVDVNVHPAKVEIRLRDRWAAERAVEQAVRRALGADASAASLQPRTWAPGAAPSGVDVAALRGPTTAAGPLFSGGEAASAAAVASPEVASDAELVVPPLFQLRRTFIAFERDEGLVLIDQHSAHERVLFERFLRDLHEGGAPAQRLLLPLTVHLGPADGDAFDGAREMLARLGYEIEPFGGHTLVVHAVPAPHDRFDAERCLRETLAALAGDRDAGTAPRHERLAATVACKAAIKAGEELSDGEMRAVYRGLAATALPAHDVHGRATVVRVGWDELERRFGRR
ncbi:MAG TPA: DNA mismatch repair endonuclease MutL [Gemmatimonadaceae bacterium]|nr:DNA mismatch repair endonuclease MutL [Gemmatimonadaceae bacterium]